MSDRGECTFVVFQPSPLQTAQEPFHRALDLSGLVRVFNANDEIAAMLACEQIVEQSRAQAAEVPGARRARGKTHAHTCAADSHFVVSHRDTPLNTGKLSRFSLVSSPQVLCEAVTSLQLRRTTFKATPRPRTPRDSPRNILSVVQGPEVFAMPDVQQTTITKISW